MKHPFWLLCILTFLSLFMRGQVSMQASLPAAIAPNSEITVQIKINKGGVANFAKYQIDVPAGVTLSEVESQTGSFSFENNRGKLIWVNIPSEAEFVVTLKLTAGAISGAGTFNQKFYYLEGGSKKEVEAEPITVNFDAPGKVLAVSTPVAPSGGSKPQTITETTPQPVVSSQKVVPVEPAPAIVEKKETPPAESIEKTRDQPKPIVESPAAPAIAAGNVVYRIQLGAYGYDPGRAKYKDVKDLAIVKEGEFYKVLVGSFKDKEAAIKRRDELQTQGLKGFVVTYQNGARVK